MTQQSGSMSRYSKNIHTSRYTPASAGLSILNWLAIVPDEPTGRKVSTLDSPTSQGPCAFIVNPPACLSACVGRHSPLLTCLPCSHLVPWCCLQQLPPVLLSLSSGRPHSPPCGHFGGQSSPVVTPGAWPPGKGCVKLMRS